jgi:hypothetical protein
MKTSLPATVIAGLCLCSCDRDKTPVTQAPVVELTPAPLAPAQEQPPAALPATDPGSFQIGEEEPGNLDNEPTPGQRLDAALEKARGHADAAAGKTEEGVRKGMEATGRAFQRVGEKIEKAASGE